MTKSRAFELPRNQPLENSWDGFFGLIEWANNQDPVLFPGELIIGDGHKREKL